MQLVFPLVGLLSNCLLRGGGLESLLLNNRRSIPGLKYVHAAIYGTCFALASGIWWHGLVGAVIMAIGQAPAWGKYIKRIMDGEWLGVFQLSVRGAFWGVCLAFGGILVHNALYAVLCVFAGALMGPVYGLGWRLVGHYPSRIWNHWTVSEMIFGLITWSPLLLV